MVTSKYMKKKVHELEADINLIKICQDERLLAKYENIRFSVKNN